MPQTLQALLVALIVLSAAVYSGWSLMPSGLRRKAAASIARRATRLAGREAAARLETRLVSSSGCSDCSSCKGCAPAAQPGGPAVVRMPASRKRPLA